jgi:hypothetical protein
MSEPWQTIMIRLGDPVVPPSPNEAIEAMRAIINDEIRRIDERHLVAAKPPTTTVALAYWKHPEQREREWRAEREPWIKELVKLAMYEPLTPIYVPVPSDA